MTRRRIGFWFLALLLFVLAASGVFVRQAWDDWLQARGIRQLDWQGLDISLTELAVDRFSVLQVQPGRRVEAEGRGLYLDWTWHWTGPQAKTLTLDRLQLQVQPRPDPQAATASAPGPSFPKSVPRWLPRQLTVGAFTAVLPCETGRCTLKGSLSATRQQSLLPLTASLELGHGGHQVQLQATLSGALSETFELAAGLAIDGEKHLTVQSTYEIGGEDGLARWAGSVEMPTLPQTDWLLDWLRQWQAMPVDALPAQPETGTVSAQWQLRAPRGDDFLRRVSGTLTAIARVPQPWPIPGVATVEGHLELALMAEQGKWLAETVQADLHLSEPAGWIRQLPGPLRPETLTVKIRPPSPVPRSQEDRHLLPLQVTLASQGSSRIDVDAHLALATRAPWAVQLGETHIQAALPEFTAGSWAFHGPRVDLTVTGRVDTEGLTLDFARNSTMQLDLIDRPGAETPVGFEGLQADLHRLQLRTAYRIDEKALEDVVLQGPIEIAAEEIRHPQLQPQSWRFAGDMETNLDHTSFSGRLTAEAGAAVDLSLDYAFGDALTIATEGRFSGESEVTALTQTLAIWPSALTVTEGTLSAMAGLRLPGGSGPKMQAQLEFKGLSGIYDRTAFTGLDGALALNLGEAVLTVEAPGLKLEEINAGIPIGPVAVVGRYQAPLERPWNGRLKLQRAVADMLGGEVRVEPAAWELSNPPMRVLLEVNGLELSRLMALYPAEGLAGTGTLNGQVPILVGPDGIRVAQGRVVAAEPGGVLKLPAERLEAIGQDNLAMGLVTEALKNFHYSVLTSTIDYAQDGTLQLGLHIEGRNPEVQEGHPFVFNINLEENIPALLTSLQLSGRVNEAITEKVEDLVLRQQAESERKSEIENEANQ